MQLSGAHKHDVWFAEEDEKEMMVAEAFFFFFLVTLELNGGSYTITVLGDRHAE